MRGVLVVSFVAAFLGASGLFALPCAPGEDEEALVQQLTAEELVEWRALRCTMSDLERRAYLAQQTPKERRAWVERFWSRLDPTPITPKNERRVEHDERVKLARTMFRATAGPGWDARGETLIRFGMPEARHVIQGEVTFSGAVPPREIWYYTRLDMIVNFEDPAQQNRFTLAMGAGGNAPPPGLAGPDDIDYTADPELAAWEAKAGDLIGPMEHEKYLKAINSYFVWRDTRQAVYSCDLGDPLTLYFDVVTYRTQSDSLMTEVCFEIPTSEVGLIETNGGRSGEVEISVLARDRALNIVSGGCDSIRVVVPNARAKRPVLVPGRVVMTLDPGFYVFSIEARDRHSRRSALLNADIAVPGLGGSPAISDIRFASGIRAGERPSTFSRGDLDIVPHPIHAYRVPFPLTLYFEIYGLSTDDEDRSSYTVEYTISPRRAGTAGKDRDRFVVTSSFESSGTGSRQAQPLQIQTENLWQGSFELRVKVTDSRTGKSAVKTGRFSVLDR